MMFCLLGQVRILKTSKVFKLNPKINNIVNVKKKKLSANLFMIHYLFIHCLSTSMGKRVWGSYST